MKPGAARFHITHIFLYCSGTCPSAKPSFTMRRLTRKWRNSSFCSEVGAGDGGGGTAGGDASGKWVIAVLAFSAGGVIGCCAGVGGAGGNSSFAVAGGGGWMVRSGHSSIVEQLVSPCPRIRGATPDWVATPSLVGHPADSWVTPLVKG